MDPSVVGDDDEGGVALKERKVVDGCGKAPDVGSYGCICGFDADPSSGPGHTSFCFLARAHA